MAKPTPATKKIEPEERKPPVPLTGYAATFERCGESIELPSGTLDALSRAGKGPSCFKLGRRIYCRVKDFHDWLDAVAAGKIDATLNPGKRRLADVRPPARRPRRAAVDEQRPGGTP